MNPLDDPRQYERLDPTRMRDLIAALPTQAREAWAAGQAWELPAAFHTPRRVVVVGVGGSAIGADLLATLAERTTAMPVHVQRGYASPVTDAGTLVVACSFSGETEETLVAFEGTLDQPGMRLALTTGGRLAKMAEARGLPVFRYRWDGPPRTALAYGLFPLLAILQRLGAIPIGEDDVERAVAALEKGAERWNPDVPEASNLAKQQARKLTGRVPVILGADFLAPAARRWSADFNENANQWAFHAALPEANHNLVVGVGAPPAASELLRAVLLDSPAIHGRNRLRVQLTAELLREAGIERDIVLCEGTGVLDSMLSACYLGDWVSLYLALLEGVDPGPIPAIERLKAALAASD